jgi:O-antigen/teichoic acid export membrane protein
VNSQVIARNSMAYGIETASGILATLATSIAMARVLGPEKLGYFNYIMLLTNMSGVIGSLGVPLTARKYMAEYLGRGEPGVARSIFFYTLRAQTAMAFLLMCAGLVLVYTVAEPAQRTMSAFQVASVFPSMLVGIPSQANLAAENMRANVPGAVVSQLIYLIAVALSLSFGWDLLGVAIGILAYRSIELAMRLIPVLKWMRSLPAVALPPELRRKMWSFSGHGTMLMLLYVVVWNRSDVLFLKWLHPDIAQVSFFSAAFGVSEKILLAPMVFVSALGASLMAQYGRDPAKLPRMVVTAGRYVLLFALPMLLGTAVLSRAIVPAVYGGEYGPAIPVLGVAATLAIFKSILHPAQQALQATENQRFLVWWGCLCAALNIGLDILLIPRHGALGAAWANGLAQAAAGVGIWIRAWQVFRFRVEAGGILKIVAASTTMAAAVWALTASLGAWSAAAVGVPAGAIVLFVAFRLLGVLTEEDRERLLHARKAMPAVARRPYERLLDFVRPPQAGQGAAL